MCQSWFVSFWAREEVNRRSVQSVWGCGVFAARLSHVGETKGFLSDARLGRHLFRNSLREEVYSFWDWKKNIASIYLRASVTSSSTPQWADVKCLWLLILETTCCPCNDLLCSSEFVPLFRQFVVILALKPSFFILYLMIEEPAFILLYTNKSLQLQHFYFLDSKVSGIVSSFSIYKIKFGLWLHGQEENVDPDTSPVENHNYRWNIQIRLFFTFRTN